MRETDLRTAERIASASCAPKNSSSHQCRAPQIKRHGECHGKLATAAPPCWRCSTSPACSPTFVSRGSWQALITCGGALTCASDSTLPPPHCLLALPQLSSTPLPTTPALFCATKFSSDERVSVGLLAGRVRAKASTRYQISSYGVDETVGVAWSPV